MKKTIETIEKKEIVKAEKVFSFERGKELLREEGKKSNFNIHTEAICMGIASLKEKGKENYSLIELEDEVLSLFKGFFNKPAKRGDVKVLLEKEENNQSSQNFKSIFSFWRKTLKENNWIK